ncbi:MAG: glycosyltransferase [Chthonomonadales bacterium]|nr:glycosyltransferase [Chthonomonadales bacterium]
MSPCISVIIPTCHRNEQLALCLDRLAPGEQTLPPDRYEVIVTDDGSASTAERILRERYPWARWVPGPRKGPAANRNSGARQARGEWLVFTDDDCLPEPAWLAAYADAMAQDALALEGAIAPVGEPASELSECPTNLAGGCFWSANISVKRSLFEAVGGFDARFPYAAHEDEDLYLRLRERTRVRFVPGARVLHPIRTPGLRGALRRIPRHSVATAVYYHLNARRLGIPGTVKLLLWIYRPHQKALFESLRRRRFRSALVNLAWLVYGDALVALHLARLGRHGC